MRVADLTAEQRERVGAIRYDRIVEKHEGPWNWRTTLAYGEFYPADGYDVLLPVAAENHSNITIKRVIPSADGQSVTIFLTDTTYYPDEPMFCGFLAVCERFPGADWYVALVYHEWFANATLTLDEG